MKPKTKKIVSLTLTLFFINLIAITVAPVSAIDSDQTKIITILANGMDADIPGAKTFIEGKIEFDETTGQALGKVNFHLTIYDDSNNKIYSIEGKLKNGFVMIVPVNYCPVRNVFWTNIWYIMGAGQIKTSDTILSIDYRGSVITLPNTEGKYIDTTVVMAVSPYGEHLEGFWPEGGWAFAGIPGFGGVTSLLKYYEI